MFKNQQASTKTSHDTKSTDTFTKNKRPNYKNKNNNSNHHKLSIGNNALRDETSSVQMKRNANQNEKRDITIIGDLIKDMKYYKMKNGLSSKDRVYIKSFPGANIECMENYVKPSIKYNPDVFLLHCGTNDLRSEKNVTEIASE